MSDPQPPVWNPENRPVHPHGATPPTDLPQYAVRPPQHGTPPPQYGVQPPPYGVQPPHLPPHLPPAKSKTPWLVAGAIAVVVALVGGIVVFMTRGSDDATAGSPMPTAGYTDRVTSSETPSPTPTVPSYTPEPTPTPQPPVERRRTLRDIDKGLLVYDDVYVDPAPGWKKVHSSKYSVSLLAQGRGAAYVVVSPVAFRADRIATDAANVVVKIDHLVAVKKEPVEVVTSANSNIDSQAQIAFTGRIHTPAGASISMVARCVGMTGVESIHNVSIMVCVEGRKDDPEAAFRDMPRMLASVARSI